MRFLTFLSTLALASAAVVPSAVEQSPVDDLTNTLAARSNDYPYSGKCDNGANDDWGFAKCQCTSFVAWRLNHNNGVKFNWLFKGGRWIDANTWDDQARAVGVTINRTPKVGCLAQRDAGDKGHVAYVTGVSGNTITVEDYNWNLDEKYGSRKMKASEFDDYLHF